METEWSERGRGEGERLEEGKIRRRAREMKGVGPDDMDSREGRRVGVGGRVG